MKKAILTMCLVGILNSFADAIVMMDASYARELCSLWDQTPALVGMASSSSEWREAPVRKLFLYRKDCSPSKQIELYIQNMNGKAECVYGGWAKDRRTGNDFLMYATTKHWIEMGRGDYGPMHAMIFGELSFSGPKFVAMANMGPFSKFLRLLGRIPAQTNVCP
ncbi:MAG: SCP2 sterol-binding domain-containing protein [Hydrogenobaculum sp.]